MILRALFALTLALSTLPALAQQQPAAPYVGQQNREVKALSPEEIRDLAEGRGMGLAKAAELNGYPGPLHVLELAQHLRLTAEQRAATEGLFRRMQADAKRLGGSILDAERELDRRFAEGRIDAAALQTATATVATLQGELRAVHLAAHLEQTAVLTLAQIAEYKKQRGYGSEAPHGQGGHGTRRH
jgi:hypothetical protein